MTSPRKLLNLFILGVAVFLATPLILAQTASTGALTGTVSDPSGAVVPGVDIVVTNEATGEVRRGVTSNAGVFYIPLLPPGSYRLEASLVGFKSSVRSGLVISVTETTRVNIQLSVGDLSETVEVTAAGALLQTDSAALGRVADERLVSSLPLASRNFTQILSLSPGVDQSVSSAAQLGRGSGGGVTGKLYVGGSRPYDNSFRMDGLDTNDYHASPTGWSTGTTIPNPEAIAEFKVQTSQYDASFGGSAGANVNVVSKTGSNEFHGSMFEFLRNEVFNANDFFFNKTGQPKPILKQNQFGFSLGGPIFKEKLLFFTSYQGTRQVQSYSVGGVRAGCNASVTLPPLTNDRSRAALGAIFAGLRGNAGGVVAADGSNINPVALNLLQKKLPDGSYLIPTPQTINPSLPLSSRGLSVFGQRCTFDEDQFPINVDYLQTEKSRFSGRFFWANSTQWSPLPTANVPGFPSPVLNEIRAASLSHSYVFTPRLFHEIRVGVSYYVLDIRSEPAFSYGEVGINAPSGARSHINVSGSFNLYTGEDAVNHQTIASLSDSWSYLRGRHSLRFGGGVSRLRSDMTENDPAMSLTFLSFADFLIGQDAKTLGGTFSNVYSSSSWYGMRDRARNMNDWHMYIQDDFRLSSKLTLNLGLRYEHFGAAFERQGKKINFDPGRADPNPPATGSLAGFIVPSNYKKEYGAIPEGVIQASTESATNEKGLHNFGPRVGFAWQVLPNTKRLVLRGGYGIHYSHASFQHIRAPAQPFVLSVGTSGVYNAVATFAHPFQEPFKTSADFPFWTPYSPTSTISGGGQDVNYRPGITHAMSMNLQAEFAQNFLLEVGYIGKRGTHLSTSRTLNQASLASASNPIRGETVNTPGNARRRAPLLGFTPTGVSQVEASASTWYNAMAVSLTRRFSKGLQFLASYTWSKSMDDSFSSEGMVGIFGSIAGNHNDRHSRWGPGAYSRPHRFIFSYVYELPSPVKQGSAALLLNGWSLSGVTTFQPGQRLSILSTNTNNAYGISGDRAQLAAGCTHGDLVTSGSVRSKLDNYFNKSCFASFAVVPGGATDFGNSGVGIVSGPDQRNFDISLAKRFPIRWPNEATRIEFRAEAFNLFNTPQFDNPATNVSTADFGRITATSVNPRIMQLALKFVF